MNTSNVMTFGKYKGKCLEILQHDPSYCMWLVEKMDQKYMIQSLREYLMSIGYAVREIKQIEGVEPDKRVINFGKYKGCTYDSIPDSYLSFILNTTKNEMSNGYRCTDEELKRYCITRLEHH